MKCEICGRELQKKFPMHLRLAHDINYEEYYNKYIKTDPNEGKCKVCSSPTTFRAHGDGYREYCSRSCQMTDTHREIQSDPIRKQEWADRSSKTMSAMWQDPEQREYWINQVSEYQTRTGGIRANVEAKRLRDPEFNLYMMKVWADNSSKTRATRYKDLYLRSSWELEFAQFLDEHNIEYTYENLTIEIDTGGTYLPDFIIPKLNLIIEIHPIKLTDEWMINKMRSSKKAGYKFYFMNENNWDKIKNRILVSYKNLVVQPSSNPTFDRSLE